MPTISIICPVYRAEKYLHRCVDSILMQTFTDFELLLIDDGSPDDSGKICDEYAVKDPRVRVFHKKNGGVSSARQCGIDNARGGYSIHTDPDDWIEPTMLEELYAKAEEFEADMVICDYIWEKAGVSKEIQQKPSSLNNISVMCDLFHHLHGSLCNKLIKIECVRRYGIHFTEGVNIYEDLIFNIELLKYPLKIAYLNRAFYHYVQHVNPNSLTRTYSKKVLETDLRLRDYILDTTQGYVDVNVVSIYLNSMITQRAFFSGYFSSLQFAKTFFIMKKDILKASNISILIRIAIYLSCVGLYGIIYFLMNKVRSRHNAVI